MFWQHRKKNLDIKHPFSYIEIRTPVIPHWWSLKSAGHLSSHSWQVLPCPVASFIYTAVGLGSYADSGAGAEKLQCQQICLWCKMQPTKVWPFSGQR